LAAALARAGVRPDLISAGSVLFALLGGGALAWSGAADGAGRIALVLAAGLCIQLRLVCNLLDGMVAVEHGRGGPHGAIWNELPDRFADLLFLVGAGYGAQRAGVPCASLVGWTAGSLAVLTAYVRELGRGLGLEADFCGPMAKPQRMAALTVGCALSALEPVVHLKGQALAAALVLIAAGAGVTLLRRVMRLARRLDGRTKGQV
jgi:phosphatidylglycerophosphate synthase